MPHVPVPIERSLDQKEVYTIDGRECEVYVYNETYKFRLLERLFGMKLLAKFRHGIEGNTYPARHIRVEVPHSEDNYVGFVHDSRGRDWPTELPSVTEHIEDAIDKAHTLIEENRIEDISTR